MVVEHCPESAKCVARSRLRQVKPLGRTSNVALGQQHLKYHQQVEVGSPKIDLLHRFREYYELD
jgi:hypothetical protein